MKSLRIMIMRTRGTIAPYIMDEFASALSELGAITYTFDFEKMQLYEKSDSQTIIKAVEMIKNFSPDLMLSYGTGGLIELKTETGTSHLAEELGIPYCLLFFDAPYSSEEILHQFANSKLINVFCWDKSYFPFFYDCGIKEVHYLPLATNPKVFNFHDSLSESQFDVSFVGTLNLELITAPPPASNGLLSIINCFFEKKLIKPTKSFEELLNEILLALPSSQQEAFKCFQASSAFPVFRQDIQRRADAIYRYYAISNLVHKQHNVSVFGNEGWQKAFANAERLFYRGYIQYGRELAKVYYSSKINLNFSVMQLIEAVNQRVFDCPSAGGFLITDYRKDLEYLFEIDEEIVCFQTLEELNSKVEEFMRDLEKRKCVVEKAKQRILANHTWQHRAKEVLSVFE